MMRWASAISEADSVGSAVQELSSALQADLQGASVDLLLVFFSGMFVAEAEALAMGLRRAFPGARLMGCSGGGVLADGQEREGRDAVAVSAASLPDVLLQLSHVEPEELAARAKAPLRWRMALDLIPEQQPVFVVLPDPFSVRAEAMAEGLDRAFPRCVKVGGLASGGEGPGQHRLLLDDGVHHDGALVLVMTGDIEARPLVAQGARPVAAPWVVTEADGQVIRTVDNTPVVDALEEAMAAMSEAERRLFRRSALVGVATELARPDGPRPTDFLVRPVVGLSRAEGALAIGTVVDNGAVVQLHVRDAHSASAELQDLVSREARLSTEAGEPAVALVFSCLGRGMGLFGVPNHDSRVLGDAFEKMPMVGFFCNGELGPVHGRTWMHGYTASVAFLRSRPWS